MIFFVCVGEVFSVDSVYLMLAEGKKEKEEEKKEKEKEGDLAEKGAQRGRSRQLACLLATDRVQECACVSVFVCVCVIQSPPSRWGLLLFSYGGYVEKDWPPNARTANPVSC